MAKIALMFAVALLLAGCAVVSDAPLFPASQAAQHAFAEGLWVASGPGCEVKPSPKGAALPACAFPFTIVHGQLTWDMNALEAAMTPSAHGQAPSLPSGGSIRLVDGDPMIIQLTSAANGTLAGAASEGGLGAATRTKPEYLALKPLSFNATGEIDRAVMWPVLCPPDPSHAPGFTFRGTGCVAQTQDAVRGAASQLRPFTSAFVTWIRRDLPPAASGPSDAALALARRYLAARDDGNSDPLSIHADDPGRLARALSLSAPVDQAALADAARQATAAALPAYREGMAKVLAEGMTEAQLTEAVDYAESKAGLAEARNDKRVEARIRALAAATWPSYQAVYETDVCRDLKCPWRTEPPNVQPQGPAGDEAPPTALAAAEAYLKVTDLYQRPDSLDGEFIALPEQSTAAKPRQLEGLMGEAMKEERANPDVPQERLLEIDQSAQSTADAATLPGYRRSVAAIYAQTYTVDELKGMMVHEEKQAAAGPAALMAANAMVIHFIISAQRDARADTRARYCAKVGCPPTPQPQSH